MVLISMLLLAGCAVQVPAPAADGAAAPAEQAEEAAAAEVAEAPAAAEAESMPAPSLNQVKFATSSNDAQDLMIVYSTAELFWPDLGFTEQPTVIVTDDILPAIVAEEAWIAQGGTSLFWAAMDEGSLDLVLVGIDKDNEIRILGARPGIKGVEDLGPGTKASGGDVGDYDELVLKQVLEELGANPDEMEILSMGGGADARMQAMVAGQLDVGIQQPRNVGPLTRAGGVILYERAAEVPQESWVVTRNVWENNRDAVCAFIHGRIQGKQWAYEGDDHKANIEQATEIVRKYDIDPTEDELGDWVRELEGNQSLDAGTTVEALDKFQADLKSLGNLSEDFDWRDHADFSCLWEAQEQLGLPLRPERYDQ
jgi:ABC-type nitrate/sulfonate/bicarbonate transport system substrate-binding protein